jgi:hypothetical protein
MDLSGSMAEAMLTAMDEALVEAGRPPLTDSSRPGLETLFIAVARGVIQHLKANENAFRVLLPGTSDQGSVDINVRFP